ncbi:MAG: HAD-IA family hydrolase [Gammaproteobacteria bacterium]|nr:HAD-IA family hydrolase [Gammaproteobacteria bacterium]
MDGIKVLVFDVGGSVFDWQTATRSAVASLAEERGVEVDDEAFCFTWRRRMFEQLGEVRAGTRPWQNADSLHRAVLDELAEQYPALELSAQDRDSLNRAWHRMGVWEDFPESLKRLRERYIVSILTVLSLSIVVDSSRHAGIDWDAYLSCEMLGVYKPEAEAYQKGVRLLGAEPHESMMVAVHPPDLLAAQRAGLKAGYVKPKLLEMGSRGETSSFEIVAEDYRDFADKLGC